MSKKNLKNSAQNSNYKIEALEPRFMMDANVDDLVSYVGGAKVGEDGWGYDGDEVVANKAIKVVTEQGLDFEIPNGDIEAVINADMSAKGIFLVDFTVTPCAVTAGKALRGVPKKG